MNQSSEAVSALAVENKTMSACFVGRAHVAVRWNRWRGKRKREFKQFWCAGGRSHVSYTCTAARQKSMRLCGRGMKRLRLNQRQVPSIDDVAVRSRLVACYIRNRKACAPQLQGKYRDAKIRRRCLFVDLMDLNIYICKYMQ